MVIGRYIGSDRIAQQADISGLVADIAAAKASAFELVIDGGGSAITTGIKGFRRIPFACQITKVSALADQNGNVQVDIWKDTFANYPPNDADSITASAPILLSGADTYEDAALTGWTKTLAVGDAIYFNVDSAATITQLYLSVEVQKTS